MDADENARNGSAKGEKNDKCADAEVEPNVSCGGIKEIELKPLQILENLESEASLPSEISKIVPENNKEQSSVANVTVKEETCSDEIDYGMPIAKTPMHTSFSGTCESMADILSGNQDANTNSLSLDKFTSKSALDEYLDGMVTPIVPRLRVKTELALFKPPQPAGIPENNDISKDSEATNTEACVPPPPPIPSLNSNADVADGIATPRISLASINRLRVKSEFSVPPTTGDHNEEDPSENFFDDLMNAKNSEREAGEISPDVTDDASDDEAIPNDYFDDLLIDELKEKIDATQNNDLEVKYSDRLKELERLKNELRRVEEKKARKNRKKQKKAKKKSKRRSRSRSLSPRPSTSRYDRNKRSRVSPPLKEQSTSSNYLTRKMPQETLPGMDADFINIKTEYSTNELDNFRGESLLDSVQEPEVILTPKQKKERAIKRATALLHYIKNKSEDNADIFYEFPFVSTVRKLPTSHSYVQQQIYENRSPLHTINNVSYKFNSHSSRFKTEEWGLAVLPPIASKVAKLVGCDAEFIYNKLRTIKIPAKLKKVKQESNKEVEHAEEELIATSSSLYSNAMTQTDDVGVCDKQDKEKGGGHDIGMQVKSESYSIGCQTLESQSPTKKASHKSDELPLMKLIQDLNENQLLAIHSFAELIKEQNANSNAMEMYKIQMQIMDIYKMSQMPSALEAAQPAIVNNYATRPLEQANLCIRSVEGADGRQFTVNDSRSKASAAYFQRNTYNDVAASSSKYEPRYEQHNYAARPSTSRGYSQTYFSATSEQDSRYPSSSPSSRHHPYSTHSSQVPPATVKRYGRGALRR